MRTCGKKKLAKLVLAALLSTGGVLCSSLAVASAEGIDIKEGDTLPIAGIDGTGTDTMLGPLWSLSGTDTTLNILSGTWMNAFAAKYGDGADANGGILNIKDGIINAPIYGGLSKTGAASGNIVNIYGGTINGNIYGGNSVTSSTNNVVNIYAVGDIAGGIYAGMSGGTTFDPVTGSATYTPGISTGNVINILGQITISGYLDGDGTQTLNVASMNNTVSAINDGLQNINFFLPKDINCTTDKMLIVETYTGVDGAKIGVMAKDGTFTTLKDNDKVTLINATGGITGTVAKTTEEIVIPESLTEAKTLEYEISQDANNIYATILKVPGGESGGGDSGDKTTYENIQKSPVETRAATVTMLNAGADMLASQGFAQAANAVAIEAAEQAKNGAAGAPVANSFTPFAAFGGSSMRAESGSHVDTKGFGINVGFAKEFANSQGKLLFGPVVEYGGGKYDSYNDDVHGDGGSHYWGFGLMARQTNHDGFYYEGSVRFGRVTSDYSADLPTGVHASYDSASNYWAAHLGLGKVFSAGKQDTVDGYLKYFYSHQGGDDTNISLTGAGVVPTDIQASFDSVDSNRIRIGARYTHKINEMNSIYGGLAYQYEFGGEARAHYSSTPGEAPSPSVKGSSGMLELGWQVKPGGPVTIDLGVTGWAGKQRGGSVQLGATWTF